MSKPLFPDYLSVSSSALGQGTPVQVRILGDMANLAEDLPLLAALRIWPVEGGSLFARCPSTTFPL